MKEPDVSTLPGNLHPKIIETLERCLEKDPKNRYSGISDARVDIQGVLADPGGIWAQSVATVKRREKLRLVLPWIAAIATLCIIITSVAVWKLKPPEPRQVTRFEYDLPEGQQFSSGYVLLARNLAVSPDGKQFVYSTTKGLYLRSLDELTAGLIAGTERSAWSPFFSPDGKWVGYFSAGQLKKISINGGAPVTLYSGDTSPIGAWWSADNTIVYGKYMDGIMRISANGGTPQVLVKMKSGSLAFPQLLPGGESILYTAFSGPIFTQPTIMVQPLKSGAPKKLFAGAVGRYVPTGHIVYMQPNNTSLFAVPFDLDKLEVTGGPVPVVEGVGGGIISDSGTLSYIPFTPSVFQNNHRTLVWVDRKGKEESIGAPPNFCRFPNISPDGTRAAMAVFTDVANADIWVWDLARKVFARLTFEELFNLSPIWTRDGKRIAFYRGAGKHSGVYWKSTDGIGKDEQLCSIEQVFLPYGWSGDGETLVGEAADSADIVTMAMKGGHERKPLLKETYVEMQPKISPDGRWMAYMSDESRSKEIYVRPFPDVNKGRWQVSTNGGDSPLWSPDGRELFYRNGDAVMAVPVKTEPDFSIEGMPQILFRGAYVQEAAQEGTPWDISPDGKRFLMMKESSTAENGPQKQADAPDSRKIIIVTNWFEELKERVPVE